MATLVAQLPTEGLTVPAMLRPDRWDPYLPHQLAESRTFEEANHDDDLNFCSCILSQAVSRTELDHYAFWLWTAARESREEAAEGAKPAVSDVYALSISATDRGSSFRGGWRRAL